jgi:serine/threonine protein kinase
VNVLKIFQTRPHPNVLQLLEAFAPCVPNRPQWVFATVEAETTLRAFMFKHDALLRQGDGAAARDLGRQILEGIRHMHRHHVIHRDLKPENMLVSFDWVVRSPAPSQENLTDEVGAHTWQARVQIADFSRARVMPEMVAATKTRIIEKRPLRSNIAAMSVMICTRPYAAPELMAEDYDAKHAYGTSVDVWSFGCVFFELLIGDHFAPGKNCLELVAWWQVRLERPLPDHLCEELSVDLKTSGQGGPRDLRK